MVATYKLHSVGYRRISGGCRYTGFILPSGSLGSWSKDNNRKQYRMEIHTQGSKIIEIKFISLEANPINDWCTDRPPPVPEDMCPISLTALYYIFPQIKDEVNMFALAQTLRDQ